jgi:RNA recognition motif-containing protein
MALPMRIYVANVHYDATEPQLQQHFEQVGPVKQTKLIYDKETQKPRGIAFVEMVDPNHGREAIEALEGQMFMGRALRLQEALPRNNERGAPRG